jgi:hypothetical protein
MRGSNDGKTWLVRLAGGEPELVPVGPQVVAAPDGWGAWEEEGALRVGPLDSMGDPAADGTAIARASSMACFPISGGQVRAVHHWDDAAQWLIRSRDGGATWPERILLTPAGATLVDVFLLPEQRRADLVWSGADGLLWLSLSPATIGGPLAPRPLPVGSSEAPLEPCAAGTLTWWCLDSAAYRVEESGVARQVSDSQGLCHLWRCAGDRAVTLQARQDGTAQLVLCAASGCKRTGVSVDVVDTAPSLALSGSGRFAVESEGVVVVWTWGDPPRPVRAARLAEGHRLTGLVEWSGQLSLVTRTADAVRLIPLSL